MFLTTDILRQHQACDDGIRYIERFYPNGAELIDIIKDHHISKDFLHWGRKTFTVNEEEFAAYCVACKIVNSEGFWNSQNVVDSRNIINSKAIQLSQNVFNSEEISDSIDVVNSKIVSNSKQVYASSFIDNCKRIYSSENTNGSTNICKSKMISNSHDIIRSNNVFNSSKLVECENATDAHFCRSCVGITNSLFCVDIKDAEYHIFNKPVDKNRYEMILSQYNRFIQEGLNLVEEWPEGLLTSTSPTIITRFDKNFETLTQKSIDWIKTLPGYDATFFYKLTLLPQILKSN